MTVLTCLDKKEKLLLDILGASMLEYDWESLLYKETNYVISYFIALSADPAGIRTQDA
jgi:hypothetical protein